MLFISEDTECFTPDLYWSQCYFPYEKHYTLLLMLIVAEFIVVTGSFELNMLHILDNFYHTIKWGM